VADQLEIRGPHGERLLAPVRPGTFVVGSDPSADVHIAWPGIGAQHFRFVRTDGGVRVEPVRPGATVAINGEELFCKELVPGDVIAVAGVQLRWLPGEQVPAPVPAGVVPARAAAAPAARAAEPRGGSPGARAGGARAPRSRAGEERAPARSRTRRKSAWLPVTALFAAVVLAALLAYRFFSNSTWPRGPQHYVDLARAQLQNHRPEDALRTLALALNDATGATREQALRLDAEIRRLMVELAEAPKIDVARQEQELLAGYAARYLRDGAQRPAARDFVRQCDAWLQKHREVCARVPDGQLLLRQIEQQRAQYAALAALGEPDTATDVTFAARARLRFQWRDYRGALALLDAFLAANPGDAAVRAEREAIVTEGEQWFTSRLRSVDNLLARGDTYNAEKDLAQLERWSVLPAWQPQLAERKAKLASPR
jgi:hypothetical protein